MNISKSKYIAGLQCPKLLWYHYNQKDAFPPVDEKQQAVFDQGREVEEWMKKRYPGAIEIPFDFTDFPGMEKKTLEALPERKVIFEGSFSAGGVWCRMDVLVPVDEDAWDIIEVKSCTKVKDEHIPDAAVQLFCARQKGLKIHRVHLMHLNNEYVREGDIDTEQLFTLNDITEDVELIQPDIPVKLEEMRAIISGAKPDVKIGSHCDKPYECPLKGICWNFLPEDSVMEFYRSNIFGFSMIEAGYNRIVDVPAEMLRGPKHRIQQEVLLEGKPHVEKAMIKDWLDQLEYPLYFLDFETANPAIPLWDGTRPYQQVPFQLSLHVLREPDGQLEHYEYLHQDLNDPRPGIVETLHKIGPEGTILAYWMSFEKGRILELSEQFPDEADFLLGLNDRMMDLITPFQQFWLYHPKQHGLCSIKSVLPALTDITYEGMEIAEGNAATRQWLKAIKESSHKEQILNALREYCTQDTYAMVELLKVLGSFYDSN